jgi:hypothetical protein
MTSRYRLTLIAVAICCVLAAPACYTLLEHPRLASLDYQRPDDKRCANCHTSEEIWAFNNPPRKPTFVDFGAAWFEYYDVARWYQRSWNFTPRVLPETKPQTRSSKSAREPSDAPIDATEQSKK